jgi:hypothetical protein
MTTANLLQLFFRNLNPSWYDRNLEDLIFSASIFAAAMSSMEYPAMISLLQTRQRRNQNVLCQHGKQSSSVDENQF